ncbi:flagellar biosynthesis anti-sigma factor FlgM [Amphibacillus sediminis]|uniref:flagellar biosynthesis anti-sigma factor FlgM n=1 Tax=Amphibacillus sediminis TaxID=360185 RepID=UPI00082D4F43|nr:flagellar biosynthesis anti-sigma factor FlgM [Amphibacillus sediminis]
MVLKIHGSNQSHMNPYHKQLQKQAQSGIKYLAKADQLQISDQAKKMQESQNVHESREPLVNAIKSQVETGQYKVDPEKVAQKILRFWQ